MRLWALVTALRSVHSVPGLGHCHVLDSHLVPEVLGDPSPTGPHLRGAASGGPVLHPGLWGPSFSP